MLHTCTESYLSMLAEGADNFSSGPVQPLATAYGADRGQLIILVIT